MRGTWEDPAPGGGMGFAVPPLTRAVKALLIANVVVFLLQTLVLEGTFPRTATFFHDAFALSPAMWRDWFPFVPVWQLLGYGFMHGSASHILFNMLFLYFLGTMLESELGARRFLVFYLGATALAGLFQLGFGLALGQTLPIVGASGGVLAIVCAMATLRPTMRVIFIIVPVTLRTVALIAIGLDLYGAILELKGQTDNVARFAHLFGGLFGYLAVKRAWIWRDPLEEVDRWRERRREVQAVDDAQRLDELLEKINREGIHALSARERAFLKRVSQRK